MLDAFTSSFEKKYHCTDMYLIQTDIKLARFGDVRRFRILRKKKGKYPAKTFQISIKNEGPPSFLEFYGKLIFLLDLMVAARHYFIRILLKVCFCCFLPLNEVLLISSTFSRSWNDSYCDGKSSKNLSYFLKQTLSLLGFYMESIHLFVRLESPKMLKIEYKALA